MFKILTLTTGASLIRLLFGLAFNKVVALTLGPSGLILISNFQNILQVSSRLSNAGVDTGIASNISRNNYSVQEVVANANFIFLIFSVINALLVYVYIESISKRVFLGPSSELSFDPLFLILVLVVFGPFMGLVANLTSIANGLERARSYAISVVLSSVSSFIFLVTFFSYFQTKSLLILWCFSQSMFLFFFLLMERDVRKEIFKLSIAFLRFKIIKDLLSYSQMTLISVITTAITAIIFRHIITTRLSIVDAGSWQALVKLTETINGILFLGVTFYMVPMISKSSSWNECNRKIFHLLFMLTGVYALGIFLLYFLSDYVILILYTEDFVLSFKYVFLQFLGGYVQILAWALGLILVVKKMNKFHLISQLLSVSFTIFIGVYFVGEYLILGAFLSFILSSFLLLTCNYMFALIWFKREEYA